MDADATGRWRRLLAPVVALGLAVVALAPIAVPEAHPLAVRTTDVPPWFRTEGTRLPSDAVVVTYPFASSGLRAPMTWQAADGLRWSLVGGGAITPDAPAHPTAAQAADARTAARLADATDGIGPLPTGTPAEGVALRSALDHWGVTVVVVPDERAWPAALRARSVPAALAWFTAALGRQPDRQDGAWVWRR